MMNLLGGSLSVENFLMVFIAVFLIAYFVYKEWPEFKKRVSGAAQADAISEAENRALQAENKALETRVSGLENSTSNIAGRMEELENATRKETERLSNLVDAIEKINDMLRRDYIRLNTAEKLSRANASAINDSLNERRIIMEALMSCLYGLKELGAKGSTDDTIQSIHKYLNSQAHVNQEVEHDAEAPKLNPNI